MPKSNIVSEHRRVIIYDRQPKDAADMANYLAEAGVELIQVNSDAQLQATLEDKHPAIFIIDLSSTEMESHLLISLISGRSSHHVVLACSNLKNSALISTVICAGATNYLSKPIKKKTLLENIETSKQACERSEIKLNFEHYAFKGGYLGFVGESEAMRQVFRKIQSAGMTEANVFITGESGTGKDVCAQAIHDISFRNQREMVSLNCGAIAANLIESEIFGHEKGAFTGADKRRDGAAQRAHEGILFLDEIGELNIDLQSKLLRFVQQGMLSRLGSDETQHVDVRFICATNRDPEDMIETGRFREDLYYRLNTIKIHMPPLRERGEDVLLVAQACLREYSEQEHKGFEDFSEESKLILLDYHWPGNVRELRNAIHNIVINHNGRLVIPSMIPEDILMSVKESGGSKVANLLASNKFDPALINQDLITSIEHVQLDNLLPLKQLELALVKKAVDLCDGNVHQAAQYLQVAPSTVYRKLGA